MKLRQLYICLLIPLVLGACGKYLDVVPDNVATIENAFTSRTTAEKFLFTCYSYLPKHGNVYATSFLTGDEFWLPFPQTPQFFQSNIFENIARGNQSIVNPTMNYWDGEGNNIKALFVGLRDCNIFLENMPTVKGMPERDMKRWMAEVKFLKAYYHFWLLRMYGPIPLIKTNLDISTGVEGVQVKRDPVDSCFNYIVQLLNEAAPDLPLLLENENGEAGRITQPILYSVKALVLTEAASPLFNGNVDFAGFKDKSGTLLFNPTPDPEKWKKAAEAAKAAKAAIDICQSAGLKLYYYKPAISANILSDTTITQMGIRNAITEKWNSEVIWANTNSIASEIQALSQARIDPTRISNAGTRSLLAPPLKMAELFYTKNGVPIDEDLTWDYGGRYTVKTATAADRYNLQPGYQTAGLHFDRENRFYADLGFDGGVWYGQGKFDDKNTWGIKAKLKQPAGKQSVSLFSVTGYWPKKLVHFQNVIEPGDGGPYTVVPYPWPVMRLADLYLLYAEALNESQGPSGEVYKWIDEVRLRAGLKGVVESWSGYSRLNTKHTTKEGMRSIIQQERLIELAFEGQRFWDILRWKKGREMLGGQVQGWDIEQEDTQLYYRIRSLYTIQFKMKDYFWPISEKNLNVNRNMVQNPGW